MRTGASRTSDTARLVDELHARDRLTEPQHAAMLRGDLLPLPIPPEEATPSPPNRSHPYQLRPQRAITDGQLSE